MGDKYHQDAGTPIVEKVNSLTRLLMHLSIVFSLLVFICCQSNIWNGIIPLKSTRADVEKILGPPIPESKAKDAAIYRTKDARVFVLYSTGPCNIRPSNGWNIPELTVIQLSFYPNVAPKLSDLSLDRKKFEKHPDPEILNETSYTNETDGISLTVDNGVPETVVSFSYFPESKYDYLMCNSR